MKKSQKSDTLKKKTTKVGAKPKYRDEFCDALLTHMEQGLSFETFAPTIGVARSTLYEWLETYPEFKTTYNLAKDRCQLFWEKAGLGGMFMGGKENPFNSTVWIFNMKNRFNWRDKQPEEEKEAQEIKIVISKDDSDL